MISARGVLLLGVSALLSTLTLGAADENWGKWRGPLGTGEGPKADPPVKWSATENVKWKVKIPGRGTGTPIIWGDQVFIQTAIPTGKKLADVPTVVPGSILAAQQQGENRPRGVRRGGGVSRPTDKPTEYHQFVIMSIDRKSGKFKNRTAFSAPVGM